MRHEEDKAESPEEEIKRLREELADALARLAVLEWRNGVQKKLEQSVDACKRELEERARQVLMGD